MAHEIAACVRRPRIGKRLRTTLALLVVSICASLPSLAFGFGFDDVAERARKLAAQPYKAPDATLPKELKALDYDQFRDIRFKPDRAVWRDAKLPFELAFFHMGFAFDQPVRINEVVGENVREIRFDPGVFDYGANKIDSNAMRGLGFAGFRVHYAINTPKYKDEVLTFLGASYFRALGKGQVYGISARGLAVDTGLASGEEFPRFVEFWIERPAPNANFLTVYALLDSKRVSGAYRFVLKPGVDTALEVNVRLFLRARIDRLGLAPMSTMYFFGENQHPQRDDFRPEVHDSDGLSIASGTGEWIWRPLVDPKRLLETSFALPSVRGFGLMQRDRNFHDYEDLEARYDLRPSVWVEPKSNWGAGRVALVQLPSPDETNDNIVAYWTPDAPPKPNEPFDYEYRILWQKDSDTKPPLAWVSQTRRGRGFTRNDDGSIGFVIDFEGPVLKKLPADAEVQAVASVEANGQIREAIAHRNEVTGGWRIALRVLRSDTGKPVELRANLQGKTGPLSETWSYILPPD